ncbi:MAG: ZIP family metal transporter [Pirellulales bacterium]
MASPLLLLGVYCLLILLGSLAGGWIPLWVRLTHTRLQLAMSFVGGAMLGVGLLHLLPHAFYASGSIRQCVWGLCGGFLFMFFVERVFHFHQHATPAELGVEAAHGEQRDHAHGEHSQPRQGSGIRSVPATESHGILSAPAAGEHNHGTHQPSHRLNWGAALAGLTLHSMLDGVALAASVAAESEAGGHARFAGLVVFLAVFLHKPFDSMTLGTLMALAGRRPAARHVVNALYALAVPAGVLLFQAGIGAGGASKDQLIGWALAFAAGTFVCIATSDLLPELQFHSHDRLKLSAALLLGLGLAAAIESGHDHPEPPGEESHEHEHGERGKGGAGEGGMTR